MLEYSLNKNLKHLCFTNISKVTVKLVTYVTKILIKLIRTLISLISMLFNRKKYHPYNVNNVQILITGQPRAGKTSLVYRYKLNEFLVTLLPTTGSPLFETINARVNTNHTITLTMVDLGREIFHPIIFEDVDLNITDNKLKKETNEQLLNNANQQLNLKILPSWTNEFLSQSTGVFFVIDGLSSSQELCAYRSEFEAILYHDELTYRKVRVAIIISKKDSACTIPVMTVIDSLNLPLALQFDRWNVFTCSAKSGDGLSEALTWVLPKDLPQKNVIDYCPGCLEMITYNIQEQATV